MLKSICEKLGIREVASDAETRILSENTAVDELADELKERMPRDPTLEGRAPVQATAPAAASMLRYSLSQEQSPALPVR